MSSDFIDKGFEKARLDGVPRGDGNWRVESAQRNVVEWVTHVHDVCPVNVAENLVD